MTIPDTPGRLADDVVRGMAATLTRRRLLRRTGTAALALTMGGAFLGKAERAWAIGTCYGLGNGPCGPSPLCSGTCSSDGRCHLCYRRKYATYTCDTTGTVANCWTEYCNCGTSWPGTWSCCDCCCPSGGGSACSGCGSTSACICRKLVGSC